MLGLEQRFGKPIERVLADTITEAGSVQAAADTLGVNYFTLNGWLRYLRIETRTVAVLPSVTQAVA